jgi:CRISPR-associated protein Csb1
MNLMNMEHNKQLEADIDLLDNLLGVEARKPGKAASLPAAIRIIEPLEPTGGKDIPVFPASYAGANDQSPPVYDLAGIEYDEGEDVVRIKNSTTKIPRIKRARLCTIDAPQSQANRMEPAFLEADDLRELVPQATATIPKRDNDTESVLKLPHRVADFRVRLSDKADAVKKTIASFAKGDALPLLYNFPTSLLFGFWDSRSEEEVGVKHARILLSRIDAHDVVPCRRHSLYSGPYSNDEFREVVLDKTEIEKKKLSAAGFTNAPSDGLGGVLVNGKIERVSVLSLSDIARINCLGQTKEKGKSEINVEKTNAARRYLFTLAALAEGHERSKGSHRLRSGCELIAKGEPIFEFRGAQPQNADELRKLYNERVRLIEIAKESMKILGIKTEGETYEVTKETLRGHVVSDDEEAKRLKKETAEAKKAADKAESMANKAEEKASKPNAKDKDIKDAEEKRKKANELSAKAKELAAKLPETSSDDADTIQTQSTSEVPEQ